MNRYNVPQGIKIMNRYSVPQFALPTHPLEDFGLSEGKAGNSQLPHLASRKWRYSEIKIKEMRSLL